MISHNSSMTSNKLNRWLLYLFQTGLVILVLLGLYLRFAWVNWSQGANLHPDEYGLTNTLTQLSIPKSIADYFNTRESSISPYPRYDEAGRLVENGPDNSLPWGQWPMILIRFVAEETGNTDYDSLRLTGRSLSALADAITVLFTFLIGMRIYGKTAGLLAACFSALSVLQIQQSHFMTVDNFSVVFSTITIYACVRIAQEPGLYRKISYAGESNSSNLYYPSWISLSWYIIFGVAYGMALASKINLLPIGGIVFISGFMGIADLKLRSKRDLRRIFLIWILFIIISLLATGITFRLTQPMSFRQQTGNTTILNLHLNPDWVENMKQAQLGSNGINTGPPGEQWVDRPAIIFPWINIVFWGMGLPLGLLSSIGFVWAAWRLIRYKDQDHANLIPLVWTGGYFLFMATRWTKSIRYFLPIYPFLALFSAWCIGSMWQKYTNTGLVAIKNSPDKNIRHRSLPIISMLLVTGFIIFGTLAWVMAFVNAVYLSENTRVQATRWIFENVPGPIHLSIIDNAGVFHHEPVPAPDGLVIRSDQPFTQAISPKEDGLLSDLVLPHAIAQDNNTVLQIIVAADPVGHSILDQAIIPIKPGSPPGQEAQGKFVGFEVKKGSTYYLLAKVQSTKSVTISRTVISNESWDEGLPFPFDGWDPFGQLYRGVTMEVRWYDDENKREMFLNTLSQVDYLILPSQRAIWTTCRIPRTYPMTMAYYRSLFDGKLGFKLVGSFSNPLKIGPVIISDLAGSYSINEDPSLPLFNHNLLAAEEAFSVYDHPPVWIFQKTLDYDQRKVETFFYSLDLKKVVVQSPREADLPPCQ